MVSTGWLPTILVLALTCGFAPLCAFFVGKRWEQTIRAAFAEMLTGPMQSGLHRMVAEAILRHRPLYFAFMWFIAATPIGCSSWGGLALLEYQRSSPLGQFECAVNSGELEGAGERARLHFVCSVDGSPQHANVLLDQSVHNMQGLPRTIVTEARRGILGSVWLDGSTSTLRD